MIMNRSFTDNAWSDYLWLQKNDKKALKRVNDLIKETTRTPFKGIGKPEPLHGELSGYWSRRINQKDRLIYGVTKESLIIIACRTHYSDK